MDRTKIGLLSESLAALLIGSLLYMLARPANLVAFDWFDAVGLGHLLAAARSASSGIAQALPHAAKFSLPDGLWAFAFTNTMVAIWRRKLSRASAAWIALGPVVAIGSELGQALDLVPGTFDTVDLVCVVAGGLLPLVRLRGRDDEKKNDVRPTDGR